MILEISYIKNDSDGQPLALYYTPKVTNYIDLPNLNDYINSPLTRRIGSQSKLERLDDRIVIARIYGHGSPEKYLIDASCLEEIRNSHLAGIYPRTIECGLDEEIIESIKLVSTKHPYDLGFII